MLSSCSHTATGKGTCCQCTNTTPLACRTASLRIINARTGEEQYSLDRASPGSAGFAGVAPILADVVGSGQPQIIAATGEGDVVLLGVEHSSVPYSVTVLRTGDTPLPQAVASAWGWGGGLSVGDFEGDGSLEIACGGTVYNTGNGAISLRFSGAGGSGSASQYPFSQFVPLSPISSSQLLAGRSVYRADGTVLWTRADLVDGYSMASDLNGSGAETIAYVVNGSLTILDGATGETLIPAMVLPGTGHGGMPLIADFDGDGAMEIGVDMANRYTVAKPDFLAARTDVLWSMPNYHLSSSMGRGAAHDFDGSGRPDVVFADNCFLWVFDGRDGAVRFSRSRTSFVATSSPVVTAGNIVLPSSGVDPGASGWKCMDALEQPVTVNGVTWTPSDAADRAYRGISVLAP